MSLDHAKQIPMGTTIGFILLALFFTVASPSAQTPDRSWTVGEYRRLGMPDPERFWSAKDYRVCLGVLQQLDRTNRAALPRLRNPASGPIFARLTNPTNTLVLTEKSLPAQTRVELFYTLMNKFDFFQEIYKLSILDTGFVVEAVDLNRVFLRLARSAIEWDGKPLPGSANETEIVFLWNESFFSMKDLLLNDTGANARLPRGGKFPLLGGACARIVSRMLPWLADGTGLPDAQRLIVVRFLREDLPVVWKQFASSSQRDALADLTEVLRNTKPGKIRQELEALRGQLTQP
jgi:hypothetical protein